MIIIKQFTPLYNRWVLGKPQKKVLLLMAAGHKGLTPRAWWPLEISNKIKIKVKKKFFFLNAVPQKWLESAVFFTLYTLSIYISLLNQLIRNIFEGQPVVEYNCLILKNKIKLLGLFILFWNNVFIIQKFRIISK